MRSDVLTSNGVVHVIDSVLLDTKVNVSAAVSACVSCVSSTTSLIIDILLFPIAINRLLQLPHRPPSRPARWALGLLLLLAIERIIELDEPLSLDYYCRDQWVYSVA